MIIYRVRQCKIVAIEETHLRCVDDVIGLCCEDFVSSFHGNAPVKI